MYIIKKWRLLLSGIFLLILVFFLLSYVFPLTYLVPFTDNAFIVNNVTPVSAIVNGYITAIFIKNGQKVTAGQALFTVYSTIYQTEYQKAQANYFLSEQNLNIATKQTQKSKALLQAAQINLAKTQYEYTLKTNQAVSNAIPKLVLINLNYDIKALKANIVSLQKQVEINSVQIMAQQSQLLMAKAEMEKAQVNLQQTTIYSLESGYVQNMYLGLGTPVKSEQPLFSIVDINNVYVQANFSETDLMNVHRGSHVYIFPKMYLGHKIFRGTVISDYWSSDRQITNSRNQMQILSNGNQGSIIASRLPVEIKTLDSDSRYPLREGMSAYVLIR